VWGVPCYLSRIQEEPRFATNMNHRTAQQVVAKAHDTECGIALGDLTGIRHRTTVQKAQRRRQHSGAFHQFRAFIQYKARLAGVPVALVDPRPTSRICPQFGMTDKRNRPDQAHFRCIGCGFAGPADTIAAGHMARRPSIGRTRDLPPSRYLQAPPVRAGSLTTSGTMVRPGRHRIMTAFARANATAVPLG
jgi:IS605 OrfB family transposase